MTKQSAFVSEFEILLDMIDQYAGAYSPIREQAQRTADALPYKRKDYTIHLTPPIKATTLEAQLDLLLETGAQAPALQLSLLINALNRYQATTNTHINFSQTTLIALIKEKWNIEMNPRFRDFTGLSLKLATI